MDEHLGLSRNALSFVPMLMLPAAIGALVLLAFPGSASGTTAIIFASVALSWYLLGGAISASHALRGIASRRALRAIRAQVVEAPEALWICDTAGLVLLESPSARSAFGEMTGRRVDALVGRFRADAQDVVARLSGRACEGRRAELDLPHGETLAVNRVGGSDLQVWSHHPRDVVPPHVEADPQPEIASDVGPAADFEHLPVALVQLDAAGIVRQANAAARALVGGLFADTPLGALLEGPGRAVGDWVSDVAAGRADNRVEILRLRRDDAEQYFQVSLSADRADPTALIAVLTDASALKKLEVQFAQSQKMQAIGQLAGGIAHDFNNLLTAISGHCDLLMLRHDKADPDYADLDQISQNANRAAALVSQLLAFSRKQTLKPEVLDLRDTLADLTHLLNRLVGERIALRIQNEPALQTIRADRRQLEQVIMNLVVNARDAMPEGGDITVRTRNIHLDQCETRGRVTLPRGAFVQVEISDEGTGIPPDILDKIFEPFFTTKRVGEGTGLGLSTAYGIVKQTGGYIFCDSVIGQGTVFTLLFPIHEAAPDQIVRPGPSLKAQAGPTPDPEQPATVLLVEDEAPVRAFAARALRLKGFDVLEADCAEAALDLLADDRIKVDIFVTDVVMPGMDGPSWVRRALKDRPEAKVIFMSGYTEDIFGEGHAPVPNSAFLAKPFTLVELTDSVSRQLSATSTRETRH
ncbi:ATP-binding protein [Paracoccus sp. TK19116]|uniref:histidine kinase n=1 Tax=Paracoccus albicereus TaxID=2922394 RepID=A0ABT1MTJ7_9RHOB|nr:PAS domain-containing sensor histidine kinase [Paracoccus albicereus]MCQ0971612.1 ATP-binding protein [Paracoccus albicereus]